MARQGKGGGLDRAWRRLRLGRLLEDGYISCKFDHKIIENRI